MVRAVLLTASLMAAGAAGVAGCYSTPAPDCGFFCGPGDTCPSDYFCGGDHRCHRQGGDPSACPDARVPIDGPIGFDGIDYDADLTPPAVLSTIPMDGAVGASAIAAIQVMFTEPVIGVDSTTFLVATSSLQLSGLIVTSDGGTTWRFQPNPSLPPQTIIYVELTSAIRDGSGNSLVTYDFSFTTQ